MKSIHKYLFLIFLVAFLMFGCSRKKNTFISRNYHAVTSEFNVLYNGQVSLQEGVRAMEDQYRDDYWELLPVEQMEALDILERANKGSDPKFEYAEEKAVKAVQKHSINIKGREHNPQMDEAYLLLGKARYYDQRFIPALDALNNILSKYPGSSQINQVKIWREKANIRLENTQLAIDNLESLMGSIELKKQDLADANAALAQAYINKKSLDTAVVYIDRAAKHTKIREQEGRYNFIKGQLYTLLDQKDSANLAFDEVIALNRKIPREYFVSAQLEKIKNFDTEEGDKFALMDHLDELAENRENRPYLDRIYHHTAEFYRTDGKDSLAILYYNKSLRQNSPDKKLLSRNYTTLADMYFAKAEYKMAGNYYDSTLTQLTPKTKEHRRIERKRDNLKDVILYEDLAMRNDSILHLTSLSEEDRWSYFKNYTDKLKAEDEAKQAKLDAALKEQERLANKPEETLNRFDQASNKGSTFYFYNSNTVAYGKEEFIKYWGNREYKENWRWSKTMGGAEINSPADQDITANSPNENRYDPAYYSNLVPTDEKQVDSIAKERNFAYYQLGLLYRSKFRELDLAKDKLQSLLRFNPEERLLLPAKYNLYKIHMQQGNTLSAEHLKKDLIENHADSRYASILSNPDGQFGLDQNSPEGIFKSLEALHQEQQYQTVIDRCNNAVAAFEGEPVVPQFEFLKAKAQGRLYGLEPYEKSIHYIALNYPSAPEGRYAQEIISQALPKLKDSAFVSEAEARHFKIAYVFETPLDGKHVADFRKKLEIFLQDNHEELTTSIDLYDPKRTFVVVHGLKTKQSALTLQSQLTDPKKGLKAKGFVLSNKNYETIQIHKNLASYLEPK